MANLKELGLSPAQAAAALYNASCQQGMGFLDARGREPMTAEEAAKTLAESPYIDYWHGRVMKVDFAPEHDEIDLRLYDRDNGTGAGDAALLDAAAKP